MWVFLCMPVELTIRLCNLFLLYVTISNEFCGVISDLEQRPPLVYTTTLILSSPSMYYVDRHLRKRLNRGLPGPGRPDPDLMGHRRSRPGCSADPGIRPCGGLGHNRAVCTIHIFPDCVIVWYRSVTLALKQGITYFRLTIENISQNKAKQ